MTAAPEATQPPRKLRRWLLVLAGVATTVAIGVLHSPLMAVETVEILGADRVDVRGIVDDLGLGAGAFLLWINAGEVEEAIISEPWVADVQVDRIWPDKVVVEVIEHEAVVWIEGVLGWMLVSRDGTVLERAVAPGAGLLLAALAFPDRLAGDRPIDPAWHEIVEMALVLSDDIGVALVLEMRGAEMWTKALGFDVRLGHPIDLADKGRTLRAMLAEDIPDGAIIDVSSPRRPAIVPAKSQG